MRPYWELLETRDELNMKLESLSADGSFVENYSEVLSLLNEYKTMVEKEIFEIDTDD